MLTIGRHYHGPLPETEGVCDYCGVAWHRRKLKLTAEGYLACPDDWKGRTALELDRARAAAAGTAPLLRGKAR